MDREAPLDWGGGGGGRGPYQICGSVVPVYSMSCFKLPRGLCEHINTLIRKFWWGSKHGERRKSWVSWEVMIRPQDMGGSGFRDIELFNLALLARQFWHLLTQPASHSSRILKAKYFPNSSILDAQLGNSPSTIWRSILEGRDVMKQGIIKRIGDGKMTVIWNYNSIPRDFNMRPLVCRVAEPPMLVSELIVLRFGADNKKIICYATPIAQEPIY
jgi:hypothetical protein